MKKTFRVLGVILLTILVALLSIRLFIVVALMALGITLATALQDGRDKVKGSIVFHKCCSTIQWTFVAFYLFGIDLLPVGHRIWQFPIGMIAVSLLLFIWTVTNTHTILDEAQPRFYGSKLEKTNTLIAAISLFLALIFSQFAYHDGILPLNLNPAALGQVQAGKS
jgi:hypothetical protein